MKTLFKLILSIAILIMISCENKLPETIAVSSVSLNAEAVEMTEGDELMLIATISPKDADNKSLIWSSSNLSIASVLEGKLTALKAGKAIITVKTDDGGKIATCEVTVNAKVYLATGVILDKMSATLTEGDELTLTATVCPDNATNKNVTWSSSDNTVVSVSNGNVTALKAGKATITVRTDDGGKTANCEITVNAKNYPVTGIALDKTNLSMTQYDTETLTVYIYPSNATNRNVKWASSNPSVANVDSNGNVTAISDGFATITVTSEESSCSAICNVTVTADPYEAVDLGLGVKWAAYNYNAVSSYEIGGYYLWGDPTGTAMIGYELVGGAYVPRYDAPNMNSICGTTYDIVRTKWGGKWRLPTMDEFRELYNNCTWQYTIQNGVSGMKIIGLNGNSIFLPMAGYAAPVSGPVGSYSIVEDSEGFYMTGESYKDSYGRFAYSCQISTKGSYSLPSWRVGFAGMMIRPVRY